MSIDIRDIQTSKNAENVRLRRAVQIALDGIEQPATFLTFDGFGPHEEHFGIHFAVESAKGQPPTVRIHSECISGDVFGSLRCDCGMQLKEAIRLMAQDGGLILYLRQEGRGIGFVAKMDAYNEQDAGYDTYTANTRLGFPEDSRDFAPAAQMLKAIGMTRIRLLSNNPEKAEQLSDHGIQVVEMISTGVYCTEWNKRYLEAKRLRRGHQINLLER